MRSSLFPQMRTGRRSAPGLFLFRAAAATALIVETSLPSKPQAPIRDVESAARWNGRRRGAVRDERVELLSAGISRLSTRLSLVLEATAAARRRSAASRGPILVATAHTCVQARVVVVGVEDTEEAHCCLWLRCQLGGPGTEPRRRRAASLADWAVRRKGGVMIR